MDTIRGVLESQALGPLIVNGLVVLTGAVVAIVSFAFLIPLDSLPAVTGVTIILAVSYALSIIAWVVVMFYYSGKNGEQLIWLLAHMMFLVVLPATIAATAMNVTAVQNTRNLMAGKISA
jgi:hypothetical protein